MLSSKSRSILLVLLLVLLVGGLAVTVYLSTQKVGTFELRKKAAPSAGSQLILKGPSQVEVGKPFTVELSLDTTTDSDYTISGVDAVIQYNLSFPKGIPKGPTPAPAGGTGGVREEDMPAFGRLLLTTVSPGAIFDVYPGYASPSANVDCGGITGKLCSTGYTCMYENGTTRPPYPDAMGKCVSLWVPKDMPPESTTTGVVKRPEVIPVQSQVTVSGIKNYATDDRGRFLGFSGRGVFATFTFIAFQPGEGRIQLVYRDQTTTNDTNVNGFLRNQPASLQAPTERLLTAPKAFQFTAVLPTPPPTPSPTNPPTPTPTPSLPPVKLSFKVVMPERKNQAIGVKIFGSSSPILMRTQTNVYGVTVEAAGFRELVGDIERQPTPTPPRPTPIPTQRPGVILPPQDYLVLLGETTTNGDGFGVIMVRNPNHFNKNWLLYAQTAAHLIRRAYKGGADVPYGQIYFAPGLEVSDLQFPNLIAGDLSIASPNIRQDGIINSVDVSELFRNWGPYPQLAVIPPPPPKVSDLNADGVVNNRDFAILLANFGKQSDLPASP